MRIRLKAELGGAHIGQVVEVPRAKGLQAIKAGLADREVDAKALNDNIERLIQEVGRASVGARRSPEEDEGPSLKDFLACVYRGNRDRLINEYGSEATVIQHKAAMTSTSGVLGGYTVPQELHHEILGTRYRRIVRPRANVLPMTSRTLQVPLVDLQTAPAATDTSWFGGVVCRWMDEAATLNETEPQFRQLELVAHELSGYSLISRALAKDGNYGALEIALESLFSKAVAWYEDQAFLLGNGAGRPLGVANAPAAVSVTRQTGSQVTLQDCGNMLAKLWPVWNPETTCWVVHPSTLKYQVQLTASGFGGLPITRVEGRYELLGIPLETFDGLPTLGTSKDVLLCDLSAYVIGDRSIEVGYSEHFPSAYQKNQGVFRFVNRVDAQPMLGGAVTLSDGSTCSPFVFLN